MRILTITTGLSGRENRVLTNVLFVLKTPVSRLKQSVRVFPDSASSRSILTIPGIQLLSYASEFKHDKIWKRNKLNKLLFTLRIQCLSNPVMHHLMNAWYFKSTYPFFIEKSQIHKMKNGNMHNVQFLPWLNSTKLMLASITLSPAAVIDHLNLHRRQSCSCCKNNRAPPTSMLEECQGEDNSIQYLMLVLQEAKCQVKKKF